MAARLGGEEFAVILPTIGSEQARAVAEELRITVQGLAIPHSPKIGGSVTISIGVATAVSSAVGHGMADLIERADAALHRGKAGGRNIVVLAEAA